MKTFVARQPIFDRDQAVVAYELLFRSSPDNFFLHHDGDQASSQVIQDSLMTFHFDVLTAGKKVFINVTRRILLEDLITILPDSRTVVEILEDIDPDEEVIAACRSLKKAGYVIALDDFIPRPELDPLVELADLLKIDFQLVKGDERREVVERYTPMDVELLTEKVETREDFMQALELGYHYFQGYFFCEPEVVSREEIPGYKVNYLRLLELLNKVDLDFKDFEEIIKRDLSLSYKLLRYLNSAWFGLPKEVTSIRHALVLLGEYELKRWSSLIVFRDLGEDKPSELVMVSLIRARFCELMGPEVGLVRQEFDLFFMGMLSVVDALVGRPLAEILDEISVSENIRAALMDGETKLADVLHLAQAYERGDWEHLQGKIEELRIDESRVPEVYAQAVEWAQQIA